MIHNLSLESQLLFSVFCRSCSVHCYATLDIWTQAYAVQSLFLKDASDFFIIKKK